MRAQSLLAVAALAAAQAAAQSSDQSNYSTPVSATLRLAPVSGPCPCGMMCPQPRMPSTSLWPLPTLTIDSFPLLPIQVPKTLPSMQAPCSCSSPLHSTLLHGWMEVVTGRAPTLKPKHLSASLHYWKRLTSLPAVGMLKWLQCVPSYHLLRMFRWGMGPCVGMTSDIPRLSFSALCMQDSPLGIRFGLRFQSHTFQDRSDMTQPTSYLRFQPEAQLLHLSTEVFGTSVDMTWALSIAVKVWMLSLAQ